MRTQTWPIDSRPMKQAQFESCSIRKIVGWYNRGKGPLNLEPDFQRKSVWHKKDRIMLMDTILRQFPVPALVLYRRYDRIEGRRRYDVIDGKQRLEAILLFLGEKRGEDRGFTGVFTDYSKGDERKVKRCWKDMYRKNQELFLKYRIPIVWVEGSLSEIHETFIRINSTGKKLTTYEQRHARFLTSPFLEKVMKFASATRKRLKAMRVVSDSDLERMRDVEILSEIVYSVLDGKVQGTKRALDSVLTRSACDLRSLPRAINETKWAIQYLNKLLPEIDKMRYHQVSDFYSLVELIVSFRKEGLVLDDPRRIKQAREILKKFAFSVDEFIQRYFKDMDYSKKADPLALAYINSVRGGADSEANRKMRKKILDGILRNLFSIKDKRRLFSPEQRRIIWGREKEHVCYSCGRLLTWDDFTIDHLFPHSKGGRTTLENGKLCCRRCNSRKGAKVKQY